jgi:hypothetical protein
VDGAVRGEEKAAIAATLWANGSQFHKKPRQKLRMVDCVASLLNQNYTVQSANVCWRLIPFWGSAFCVRPSDLPEVLYSFRLARLSEGADAASKGHVYEYRHKKPPKRENGPPSKAEIEKYKEPSEEDSVWDKVAPEDRVPAQELATTSRIRVDNPNEDSNDNRRGEDESPSRPSDSFLLG